MAKYTEDDLTSLNRKADVIAIAEELGLSSEGTRNEITNRILESQDAEDVVEEVVEEVVEDVVEDVVEEVKEEPAVEIVEDVAAAEEVNDCSSDTEDCDELVRARNDEGQYSPDDKDTQPSEAYAPPTPKPISDKAKLGAKILVESYFGKGNTKPKMLSLVEDALEKGLQPCVVNGSGNSRFEIKVFDVVFDKSDVSKDANRNDGVVLNLARRLAHSNLYPSG